MPSFDFPPDIRYSLMNVSELQFFDITQHFGLAMDANSDKEARYMALRNAWAVVDAKGLGFDSLRKVILAVVRGENHWLIPTPGPTHIPVVGDTTTEPRRRETSQARPPLPVVNAQAASATRTPPPPLTLLHLTDLHMGPKNRFRGEDFHRLGSSFAEQILQAQIQGGIGNDKIDLILVTGDIAEAGEPAEFRDGTSFLSAVAEGLGMRRAQVIFVPGNHDISWSQCRQVADDQAREGFDDVELKRRLSAAKLRYYETFRREFYGTDMSAIRGYRFLPRGAEIWDFSALRISIGVFNACERESHVPADRLGTVTRSQAQELMDVWGDLRYDSWKKILLVHHNPGQTVASNHESWVKWIREKDKLPAELVERFMADVTGFPGKDFLERITNDRRVQLLLHGHHHAHPENPIAWNYSDSPDACYVLSTGSWGLQDAERPAGEANTCQILQIRPGETTNLHVHPLEFDPLLPVRGQVQRGGWRPRHKSRGHHALRLWLPPEES